MSVGCLSWKHTENATHCVFWSLMTSLFLFVCLFVVFALTSHVNQTTTWEDPRRKDTAQGFSRQQLGGRAAPFFTPQAALHENPQALQNTPSNSQDSFYRRSHSMIDPRGTRQYAGGSAMLQHQMNVQKRQINELQRVQMEREQLLRRTEELRQKELQMLQIHDMRVDEVMPGQAGSQAPYSPQSDFIGGPSAPVGTHSGGHIHVRDLSQDSGYGYTSDAAPVGFGNPATAGGAGGGLGLQSSVNYSPSAVQQTSGYAPGNPSTMSYGGSPHPLASQANPYGSPLRVQEPLAMNSSVSGGLGGYQSPPGMPSAGGLHMDGTAVQSPMHAPMARGNSGYGLTEQKMDTFTTLL